MNHSPSPCPDSALLRRAPAEGIDQADGREAEQREVGEADPTRLDPGVEGTAISAGAPGAVAARADGSDAPEDPREAPGREREAGAASESRTDPPGTSAVATQRRPPGHSEENTAHESDDVPLDFLAPPERPGVIGRLGPYEVLEPIGRGGMGVVFRALDRRLNRIVAVKLLAPALAGDPVARRRFLREARAAAAMTHDHIVTIHAVDEFAGHPYLVMQLVVGESLQARLNRHGPLDVEAILRIGLQVASGLAAAHAQGLVHRDIKPANLLLENGVERVKITDFGLARAGSDAGLTATGAIAGTPHYMSPEQARGEPVDHRSDLFSLGSVLYAACTGHPPFRAETTVAVLRKVSDDPPLPIRDQNPGIPESLTTVIERLMAKDPARRYQSAREVAEVLAGQLADLQHPTQPTRPAPAPTAEYRPAKRPRRPVRAIAGLLGVAVLAIGAFSWWIPRSLGPSHVARTPAAPPPAPAGPPSPPSAVAAPPGPAVVETILREVELVRAMVDRAGDAARSGDFRRAIDLYTDAIHRSPANVEALYSRGRLYARNEIENWPAAIADATGVIRLDPHSSRAYAARAYAESRAGDHHRAIADATEAIRLDPKNTEALGIRGSSYNGLKEWDHALVDLNEAIRRVPDAPWNWSHRANAYLGLGDIDRARSDNRRAIELSPTVHHFWLQRGVIDGRKNDDEQALAAYAEAIRLSPGPERCWAYGARGGFEVSAGRIEPAIADYTEAIGLRARKDDPIGAVLFSCRADLYLAKGENERALADYDEAIRLDPKPPWPQYRRGFAHARKGQWDRAIADFATAKELAGADKHVALNCLGSIADVLAMSGRFPQAEAAYEESLRFAPDRRAHLLVIRAWFFDRPRGDYEAALNKLDEAAGTGMIWQFLDRGLILVRMGEPDRALADFREVLERVKLRRDWFATADYFPRWLALLLGRGEAYLLKGDLDRALADADESVRFTPRSAEARLLRARVHDRRGKPDLAEADRRAAAGLERDPMLTLPEPRSTGASEGR